jgi:hypothetical protein
MYVQLPALSLSPKLSLLLFYPFLSLSSPLSPPLTLHLYVSLTSFPPLSLLISFTSVSLFLSLPLSSPFSCLFLCLSPSIYPPLLTLLSFSLCLCLLLTHPVSLPLYLPLCHSHSYLFYSSLPLCLPIFCIPPISKSPRPLCLSSLCLCCPMSSPPCVFLLVSTPPPSLHLSLYLSSIFGLLSLFCASFPVSLSLRFSSYISPFCLFPSVMLLLLQGGDKIDSC